MKINNGSKDEQIALIKDIELKEGKSGKYVTIKVKVGSKQIASALIPEDEYTASKENFKEGQFVIVSLFKNDNGYLSFDEIRQINFVKPVTAEEASQQQWDKDTKRVLAEHANNCNN